MRPIFEDAFIDALRVVKIAAPIVRNARPEDVMVAAFDHIDRVDLHIAEMLHRGLRRFGSVAEGRRRIEALSAKPDAPGGGLGERGGLSGRIEA